MRIGKVYNLIFFFKQKTAYEMRISDWSSDVCSSDLVAGEQVLKLAVQRRRVGHGAVDMGLAQDLAPHLHARGMDIFVAHWSLSCCLTVTVGPAAARAAAAFPQRSPDGVRSRRTARPRAPPARHCCARGAWHRTGCCPPARSGNVRRARGNSGDREEKSSQG